MSYTDFIIFKEHKFLRNIFLREELAKTDSMKDVQIFHENFVRFSKIAIVLQQAFNACDEFDECFNDDLLDFCKNYCAGCSDIAELKDIISDVKIKNNKSGCKIPKFTLQIYAFVYQRLMDFHQGRFDYETLTTINFFESIHSLINVKILLHQSHVTGKIYGYAHDSCNMKVRENQNQLSCIAHIFFGFGMFLLIKGIKLSVWGTKDINIGGTGLTNINFPYISSQGKFVDTIKYFLTSLGQLDSTLDKVEKAQVEKLTNTSMFKSA